MYVLRAIINGWDGACFFTYCDGVACPMLEHAVRFKTKESARNASVEWVMTTPAVLGYIEVCRSYEEGVVHQA